MSQTRRERIHDATCAEIKMVARQQIAAEGAPSLSLRAIARQMGLTAPALYRYFASRDVLVTALIGDAYVSLAEALESATSTEGVESLGERFLALGLAYRDWALQHPADYNLIFGSPVPGYSEPMEQIYPLAQRCMQRLVDILEAARQSGQLQLPPEQAELLPLQQYLAEWQQRFPATESTTVLYLAVISWVQMHGLVSLELFQYLQPMVREPEVLYRFEMAALLRRIGLAINFNL